MFLYEGLLTWSAISWICYLTSESFYISGSPIEYFTFTSSRKDLITRKELKNRANFGHYVQLEESHQGYPVWKLIYREDQQESPYDDVLIYYFYHSWRGERWYNGPFLGSSSIFCRVSYSALFPIDGWGCWEWNGWQSSHRVSMTRSSGKLF